MEKGYYKGKEERKGRDEDRKEYLGALGQLMEEDDGKEKSHSRIKEGTKMKMV